MNRRIVNVKAHQKSDGTAVRSHQRLIENKEVNDSDSKPSSAKSLMIEDLSPIEKQMGFDEIRRMRYGYRKKFSELNRKYFVFTDPDKRMIANSAGLLTLSVYWGLKAFSVATATVLPFVAAAIMALPFVVGGIPYLIGKSRLVSEMEKEIERKSSFPSEEQLEALGKKYPWSPAPEYVLEHSRKSRRWWRRKKDVMSSSSPLPGGGVKVEWERGKEDGMPEYRGSFFFHPEVDMSGQEFFDSYFDLRGANLQNANFQEVRPLMANFDGANLSGANLINSRISGTMQNAILDGANLSGASMLDLNVAGVDFRSCTISDGTSFPQDLRNIKLTTEQFSSLRGEKGHMVHIMFRKGFEYDKVSFAEALESLNISEKQFEFLVTSGGIEVRDNYTQDIVKSGFDPEKHHITQWALEETKAILGSQP